MVGDFHYQFNSISCSAETLIVGGEPLRKDSWNKLGSLPNVQCPNGHEQTTNQDFNGAEHFIVKVIVGATRNKQCVAFKAA